MNAKKTTSPLFSLHPQKQTKISGKELTAGLADSTEAYLWAVLIAETPKFQQKSSKPFSTTKNSPLAQYIQHCRNCDVSRGGMLPMLPYSTARGN